MGRVLQKAVSSVEHTTARPYLYESERIAPFSVEGLAQKVAASTLRALREPAGRKGRCYRSMGYLCFPMVPCTLHEHGSTAMK